MSSKRYRRRAGEPVVRTPVRAGWMRRLLSKRSKPLWLYGVPFALVIGFLMQHLVHEALLDIVVYASSADATVTAWAYQLRAAGFHVHVQTTSNPDRVRKQLGVPSELAACHTAITVQGRYVLEGNVPPQSITDLLAKRPRIRGLAALESGSSTQAERAVQVIASDR